jgi:hypothetical protein
MEEFDYTPSVKTKQVSLDMSRFTVAEQKEHEFQHWVDKTAKLIKRPYFQTFSMMKKWPLEKIVRNYELSTKHNGNIPSAIYWFWLRKKERGVE